MFSMNIIVSILGILWSLFGVAWTRSVIKEPVLADVCRNVVGKAYFPHPWNDTKFIQCTQDGGMTIMQCPGGVAFDSTTISCKTPLSIERRAVNATGPCTAQNIANGKIYFAVATENTKFIKCRGQGDPYVLICSTGLVYDAVVQACVIPPFTTTTTAPQLSTVTHPLDPTDPCTANNIAAGNNFFAYAKDKKKFLQCLGVGGSTLLSCPTGLVFDPARGSCALPAGTVMSTWASTVVTDPANPCTAKNLANGKILFADPNYDTKFIECRSQRGPSFLFCSTGLIFDAVRQACVLPVEPKTTAQPHTAVAATTRAVVDPMAFTLVVCTDANIAAGKTFFRYDKDNTKFIDCLAGPALLSCPTGLVFDEVRRMCTLPVGTMINTTTTAPVNPINNTATHTGEVISPGASLNPCRPALQPIDLFLPHPDPTKFFQCDLVGNAYVMQCPRNLLWSQPNRSCMPSTTSGGGIGFVPVGK